MINAGYLIDILSKVDKETPICLSVKGDLRMISFDIKMHSIDKVKIKFNNQLVVIETTINPDLCLL